MGFYLKSCWRFFHSEHEKSHYVAGAVYLSLNAFSQKGDFGVGVILGNPTSFSVKYWTGKVTAIDASLGYRYGSTNDLYLNTDFLFHLWAIQKDEGLIRFYFRAGAGLGFISDLSFSVRVPVRCRIVP